jgi:leishmanolysin
LNGVDVFKIITPTVLKKARATFGWDSLDGVELESQGGLSTAGSHWEKRVMFNEFMTPDADVDDVVYSDINMALLED